MAADGGLAKVCRGQAAHLTDGRVERRRVVHFNITEFPSAAWTAQQIIEAFPEHTSATGGRKSRVAADRAPCGVTRSWS